MNADEAVRSSEARAAAELALVRVVHHYGEKPGFVLLGGLVPPLLCSHSAFRHAGPTDVDVQVDIEIASGATHTRRLEQALTNAEFRPDTERVWRWETMAQRAIVSLVIITCGSVPSTTDSGTRVHQMRCAWPCPTSLAPEAGIDR